MPDRNIRIELIGQPDPILQDIVDRIDKRQVITIEGRVDPSIERSLDIIDTKLVASRQSTEKFGDALSDVEALSPNLENSLEDLDRKLFDSKGNVIRLESSLDDIDGMGPRRASRSIRDLEDDARDATSEVDNLVGGLGRIGPAAAGIGVGAAGLGGALLVADRLGEESARILAIHEQTGITLDTIQELDARAGLTGENVDIGEYQEIANRIGEIRREAIRNIDDADFEGATIGAREALEDLGFNAEEVTQRDVPLILEALSQIEDRADRAFLGDEIFSTFFERIGSSYNLPPELEESLTNASKLSRETLEEFRANRIELQALGKDAQVTGALLLSGFVSPATTMLGTVRDITVGLNDIIDTNPLLIAAIAAAGVATVGFAAKTQILNAALAIRAALSGPAGWASLAVAAGVAGLAIYSASRGSQIRTEDQGVEEIQKAARVGSEEGVTKGADNIATAVEGIRDDTLRAITPAIDCLNDRIDPDPNPDPIDPSIVDNPFPALRQAEARRILLEQGAASEIFNQSQLLESGNREAAIREARLSGLVGPDIPDDLAIRQIEVNRYIQQNPGIHRDLASQGLTPDEITTQIFRDSLYASRGAQPEPITRDDVPTGPIDRQTGVAPEAAAPSTTQASRGDITVIQHITVDGAGDTDRAISEFSRETQRAMKDLDI